MKPGIDTSKWSGEIEHLLVKESGLVDFVFGKTSEGTTGLDPEWYDNKAGWEAVGIPQGGYHFFRPPYPADQQAEWFVDKVGSGIKVYVCDVETVTLQAAMAAMRGDLNILRRAASSIIPSLGPRDLRGRGLLSPEEQRYINVALVKDEFAHPSPAAMTLNLAEKVKLFMETVYSLTGQMGVIYTSPGFWNANVAPNWIWDMPYDLWVAHWGVQNPVIPKPWTKWMFWQYTTTLRIPGIPSYEDGNWAKDEINLYEYFGNGQEPPPPPQGFTVKITADALYMRKIPYGEKVGNLVKGNILTVTKTVKDVYGKDWYYSGDLGCFASWYTIPYP